MTALVLGGGFGLVLVVSGWVEETDPRRWADWWRWRLERLRWQRRAFRCRVEGDHEGEAVAATIVDRIDMRWRWRS